MSSTRLGSIVIFASCVLHRSHVFNKFACVKTIGFHESKLNKMYSYVQPTHGANKESGKRFLSHIFRCMYWLSSFQGRRNRARYSGYCGNCSFWPLMSCNLTGTWFWSGRFLFFGQNKTCSPCPGDHDFDCLPQALCRTSKLMSRNVVGHIVLDELYSRRKDCSCRNVKLQRATVRRAQGSVV